MKNEEKIIELLTEVLQKVDGLDTKVGQLDTEVGGLGAKLDRLDTKVNRLDTKVNRLENNQKSLISAVARHNTVLRGIADDIQELKGLKISVEELERRVDELERYTGKK